MPLAIESSKRKFHKLLESFTAPPTSTRDSMSLTSTTSTSIEPSAKRVRLNPRSTLARTSRPAVSAIPAPPKKAAAPTPLSSEAFYARLSTFSSLRNWTSKPDAVNEVRWAARGWSLDPSRTNYVACLSSCHARVLVRLRPLRKDAEGHDIADSEDYGVEVDDELVKRYEDLIVEGHGKGCFWRGQTGEGCAWDGGIMRVSVARPRVFGPQLRARYQSLKQAGAMPPRENVVMPETLEVGKMKRWLPKSFHEDLQAGEAEKENQDTASEGRDKSPEEVDDVALAFALTGWKGTKEGGSYSLAVCDNCFRRIGLWLYSSTNSRDGDEEAMKLDLIQNHRDYCPWINGQAQRMPGAYAGLPAWEILVRCIENNASFEATGKDFEEIVQDAGQQGQSGPAAADSASPRPPPSMKSEEDVEREDKVRFAKLKQLTSSIGLRGLKNKLAKSKA